MADFYAYAPLAAAAGARAYSAGRIKRQARLYHFCLTALVPPDAGTDARANTASILSPGGDLYSKSPASRFLEAERNQELFTVKVFYPSPQALSTAGRAKKPAFRQIPAVRQRSLLSDRFQLSGKEVCFQTDSSCPAKKPAFWQIQSVHKCFSRRNASSMKPGSEQGSLPSDRPDRPGAILLCR